MSFELISQIPTNTDTFAPLWGPSGPWTPDGSAFAFFDDHYDNKVTLYHVETETRQQLYDNAQGGYGTYDDFLFVSERLWLFSHWAEDWTEIVWDHPAPVRNRSINHDDEDSSYYERFVPSPDGRFAAVMTESERDINQLVIVSLAKDEKVQEARRYGMELWPISFSPDGRWFLASRWFTPEDEEEEDYEPTDDDCEARQLVLVDVETGAEHVLSQNAMQPAWLADSSGLVFVTLPRRCLDVMEFMYGDLVHHDINANTSHLLARNARAPQAVGQPPRIFFDTPFGYSASNLHGVRLMRSVHFFDPWVDPTGRYLVERSFDPYRPYLWSIRLYAITSMR